jgi:hypothetical protein
MAQKSRFLQGFGFNLGTETHFVRWHLIAKILPSFCQDRLGTSKHGGSRGTTRFCRDSIRGCARSGTKTVASFAMPFYDAKFAISLPRQARDKQT